MVPHQVRPVTSSQKPRGRVLDPAFVSRSVITMTVLSGPGGLHFYKVAWHSLRSVSCRWSGCSKTNHTPARQLLYLLRGKLVHQLPETADTGTSISPSTFKQEKKNWRGGRPINDFLPSARRYLVQRRHQNQSKKKYSAN